MSSIVTILLAILVFHTEYSYQTEESESNSDLNSDSMYFKAIKETVLVLTVFFIFVSLTLTLATMRTKESESDESLGPTPIDSMGSETSIVLNMFPNATTAEESLKGKARKDSCFGLKVKIYVALHKPRGYALLYHLAILVILFFSIIVLNIYDEGLADDNDLFDNNTAFLKVMADTALVIILTIEMCLRLWSCDCMTEYQGFRGRVVYYRQWCFNRSVELLGIIVFSASVINFVILVNAQWDAFLRITHLTQVLQLYRVLYRSLRIIVNTFVSQKEQLLIVILFSLINWFIMGCSLFIVEHYDNKHLSEHPNNFWLAFVSIATIGYGDISPITPLGKWVIVVFSFYGILFQALPSSILGTGLALQIQEDERKDVYLIPAAKLIQYVWRSYAANQKSNSTANWSLYQRRDGQPLTSKDRACIRFIRILMYLKQRHRFKMMIGSLNDDFFRERSTREMSRRFDSIEKDIKTIRYHINKMEPKGWETNQKLTELKNKLDAIRDKNIEKSDGTEKIEKTDSNPQIPGS